MADHDLASASHRIAQEPTDYMLAVGHSWSYQPLLELVVEANFRCFHSPRETKKSSAIPPHCGPVQGVLAWRRFFVATAHSEARSSRRTSITYRLRITLPVFSPPTKAPQYTSVTSTFPMHHSHTIGHHVCVNLSRSSVHQGGREGGGESRDKSHKIIPTYSTTAVVKRKHELS